MLPGTHVLIIHDTLCFTAGWRGVVVEKSKEDAEYCLYPTDVVVQLKGGIRLAYAVDELLEIFG